MLETLEDMLQLKAQAQGILLVFNRADSLPRYIYSDERKLRQVLLNLLSNALKFTKEGSVPLTVDSKVAAVDKTPAALPDSSSDRLASSHIQQMQFDEG